MTDVACFCGCVYSFQGVEGACPGCGEIASTGHRCDPRSYAVSSSAVSSSAVSSSAVSSAESGGTTELPHVLSARKILSVASMRRLTAARRSS
jgi:hypothetical protein